MDNALNNDTMMLHLAHKHAAVGLPFDEKHAGIHCMPHTVHLSAILVIKVSAFGLAQI